MAGNDYYMVRIEDTKIIWVDPTLREQRQIGITLIAAKEIEDALTDLVTQRDEYYDKLVELGVIEAQKDPKDIAMEALEEAKQARIESANLAAQLAESHAMLKQLLSRDASNTVQIISEPVTLSEPVVVAPNVNITDNNVEDKQPTYRQGGGRNGVKHN